MLERNIYEEKKKATVQSSLDNFVTKAESISLISTSTHLLCPSVLLPADLMHISPPSSTN
jgi:hypothetical protein